MNAVSRLRSWVRDTLRRSRVEQRMDDELQFHIDSSGQRAPAGRDPS
jgi:hypothetical protein